MRGLMVFILIIAITLLVISFFYPKVNRVVVSNNEHYSPKEIMDLAHIKVASPFFWITTWSSDDLIKDPWIKEVSIFKHWPDTISISVVERKPILANDLQIYAIDGTILDNVSPERRKALIQLDGWGESKLDEAVKLVDLFNDFQIEKISYVPSGLTVKLAEIEVFTPSVEMLKIHWGSFLSQVGRYNRSYIYPWGVSGKNE